MPCERNSCCHVCRWRLEVVSDNECGYLIESFREEDFIEKILKLKNDKTLYNSFSQNARRSSEKFLIKNVFMDYQELYNELLNLDNY